MGVHVKILKLLVSVLLLAGVYFAFPSPLFSSFAPGDFSPGDTLATDTTKADTAQIDLKYPFNDQGNMPYDATPSSGLYLDNPSNIKSEVEYDPGSGNYHFKQTVGDSIPYRYSSDMSLREYMEYDSKQSIRNYWQEKSSAESFGQKKGFRPQLHVESEVFDRIFGGNTIDIRPQGSAELIFGVNIAENKNPALPVKQRRISTFDFDEKIQLSVVGQIGDKMKLNTTYNTEAGFDFENQMKLAYQGHEDEIIQVIEAGNVTLPLKGSLITGSQTLFGIKTGLKFGRLDVTTVVSQQKGKKSEVEVQGGAQVNPFEVKADRYEANRHFFLSHFFRNQYEKALANLPVIQSYANITRIEVWITNTTNAYDNTRNIVAFQDLGEGNPDFFFNNTFTQDAPGQDTLSDNAANNIYATMLADIGVRGFINATALLNLKGLASRRDFEKVELAKRLVKDQDYIVHPQLGYISLNQELNPNQVLAVAYQYTYQGRTYQVGEFSTDVTAGQNALYLKMLKSSEINTTSPMWNLMMKNVYSINAYQVQKDGFRLEVWYLDGSKGIQLNYIPEGAINGKQLIKVLGVDKLNINNIGSPDGVFDYVENVTINPKNGKIYFPSLEPFGSYLRKQFNDSMMANKYAFDTLYKTTQAAAQVDFPSKNRFYIKGLYKSSASSEISLNAMNIPQGSVTVTAGGSQLTENVDYTVDYALGRVKIINQGIMESGTPVKVSLESNSLFAIQSKTMFASRFDYKVNRDLMVGGTIMNLTERPITQKINIGDEPMSNTVWGVDGNYKTDSRFLTKMVDKLPLISTKEKSNVTASGEFAQLIPGHSRAIGKNGTSYIDDFEGSQSAIDIRSFTTWSLAGTPQGQPDLFPEGDVTNNLAFAFNRARLSWYVIDPLFFRNNNLTPGHIKNNPAVQYNHFMREVFETEVFPSKQLPTGQPPNIPCFDLSFYPSERGPYNYDVNGFSADGRKFGYGLNADGSLKNPEKRWAGIMRRIETNDFDAANIEYIQFWLMDPFNEDYNEGANSGYLYFNLGEISEDIQKDESKIFENGLPTTEAGATNLAGDTLSRWGRIIPPSIQQIVTAFDNDPAARQFQDVGLDGLRNQEELSFFETPYIKKIQNSPDLGPASGAYANAAADPSADDYHFFRGDDFDAQQLDVLKRYKKYNGLDGNSPTDEQSKSLNSDGYPTSASTQPNSEDINRDNTLNAYESYFQYKVKISHQDIHPNNVGNNYITNVQPASITSSDGTSKSVNWYQFKVPIRDLQAIDKIVGQVSDFKSIRFMRVFLNGFSKPVYLRFARLELIRGDWRKYTGFREDPKEGTEWNLDNSASFNISAVNIEENSSRKPVNYVIPPGIQREINIATTNLQQLNEQALSLRVCDLKDGEFEAAYKNVSFDVRSYKHLKMYVHAEAGRSAETLNDQDVSLFVRLGTDFVDNYYEYEVPLKVTPAGFYDPNSEDGQLGVWPEVNNVDINFSELQTAKASRNTDIRERKGITLTDIYTYKLDGGHIIHIKGNPNLSAVKTIMIGIKNPKKGSAENADDGLVKCAEVWVNELRLTDFFENSGWAAIARVNAKLADFANVAISGGMSTPGYGSIDKKIGERQRETIQQWDASTSLDLGQFVPDAINLKVPMYVGVSEIHTTPQYAPLDPDIFMKDYLNALPDSLRKAAASAAKNLTVRRSINFTNVRKEKGTGKTKSHIYDVENLSLTYAYSEIYMRDINVARDYTKNYKGGLSYNFSPNPKNYSPLSKVPFLGKKKYLALVKDINFYLLPKQISFRTDMNRMYNERFLRNNYPEVVATPEPFYNQNFSWIRAYDLKYDFTKALKFDFQATNSALIGEPLGKVPQGEARSHDTLWTGWKDSVFSSIQTFGTTTDYRHNANLNYTLPLSKIPLTDWINSTAQYSATYNWMRAPFAADSLGHTIQNSRSIQLNGTGNMLTLYNKVPYLKKVNNKFSKKLSSKSKAVQKAKEAATDTTKGKKKKPPADDNKIYWYDHILKVAMGVKNVNATYSQTDGMLLAGYDTTTLLLGLDPNIDAPGPGFIFGQQNNFGPNNKTFTRYAADNGWLVDSNFSKMVTTPHSRTHTENLTLRANIEPARDLKIELTGNRTSGRNNTEFFRFNDSAYAATNDIRSAYISESPLEMGNFSVSYSSWRTAFIPDKEDDVTGANVSPVFEKFLENRKILSDRLQQQNGNSKAVGAHSKEDGYKYGYGSTSNDVLIPAFLAAYSGTSPHLVGLNPLKTAPKVNWKITYTGLSKIPWFQKFFKNVTLNHTYRSTFSITSFTSELRYRIDSINKAAFERDPINDNYYPQYQIAAVTIAEQFSPLINIDLTWNNSLLTRAEFKKDRTLSLSLANTQVTETKGNEFVVGLGYTFKAVPFPIKFGGGKKIKSDVVLRSDISVRNNVTVIRKVVENVNQMTAGQRVISIKTSATYSISERLQLRAFFDRIMTTPKISLTFPTANTNAGISIRFTLAS